MLTQLTYPDTLNLAARATMAILPLKSLRDERLNGQIYFDVRYDEDPPRAYHTVWDYGDGTGRHTDALVLAHIMTGSQEALDVAREFAEMLIGWQGDKGLSWWPQEPWTLPDGEKDFTFPLQDWKPGQRVADVTWSQRGSLMGLTSLYLLTGDDRYRRQAQAIVDGLDDIALCREDYRFFPELGFREGGWRHAEEPRTDGTSEVKGVTILPLLRFYAATGYEPALNLAGGLIRFILHKAEGYELDGRFFKIKGFWGHFHSSTAVITGVIRYGLLTNQPEFVAWGRQTYEAAKKWGTGFGWFPENIANCARCETCCITDMIELAILLGLYVDPVYLTDAERYGRNHLVESQYLSLTWADRIVRKSTGYAAERRRVDDRDIVKRSLGGFAGWSAPNDLFDEGAFRMMQCCNAAGTRALYDLWHYAVDDDGRRVRVNMAFSRPAIWGDVVSFLPYVGRVDLHMKLPRVVSVRLPEWARRSEARVYVNESPVDFRYERGYVLLEGVEAGDVVSVRYDLPLWSCTYTLGENTYIADFKGDTVVAIAPEGRFAPLYQRKRYLENQAPSTKQLWHLPDKEIMSI